MTSEPSWDNGLEGVEKQLWRVCRKLKEREVTAKILGRMAKENVATGDVRSFAVKQAKLKHANLGSPTSLCSVSSFRNLGSL